MSSPNPSAVPSAEPRSPSATTAEWPRKKTRPVVVLQVLGSERLTDHLVRVWVGGPGFAEFRDNEFSDRYCKLHFAKPELGLTPPYDLTELRERLAPEDLPVTRTYTIREVRQDRLAIDFVVHGDTGIAGPWAAAARPGDQLVLSGPGGGYLPDPTADVHVLAGDESALPAIAAALEVMPDDARGVVFIETFGPADELELARPESVELTWLHRDDAEAGTTTLLADALRVLGRPAGRVQVFAHGERESMKAVRDALRDWALPRSDLSLSGYWAHGRSEDRFQAEKREPIGVIL